MVLRALSKWQSLLIVLLVVLGHALVQANTRDGVAQGQAPLDAICKQDGKPLLFGGLEGGLNNQKWLLHLYLATAKKHGLTWVLPKLNMEYFNECNGQVGSRHAGYVYNLETLQNFARQQEIGLLLDAPRGVEDRCCHATRVRYGQTNTLNIEEWLEQFSDSAICAHSFPMFYGQPNNLDANVETDGTSEQNALFHLNWDQGDMYRAALQPSNHVINMVHRVMRHLVDEYGDDQAKKDAGAPVDGPFTYKSWRRQWPLEYTAVHARIEDDFEAHCKRFVGRNGTHGRGKVKCFYTDTMIEQYVREVAKVPEGSLVQMASGEPLTRFEKLCSTYRCFKISDIVASSPYKEEYGDCITREMYAAVEFWVGTYASAFYGNVHSSFTVELLAAFRMAGKPAAQYNEECGSLDDPDCMRR